MRRGWVWPMIWRRLGFEELGSDTEELGSDTDFFAKQTKSVSDPNSSTAQPPRPKARAILGNCVVLPEPVSPHTITTWWA